MASCKDSGPANDWYVSIPLSDLDKLRADKEYIDKLNAEHDQMRRELDGLRNMLNELITKFGELRRELKGR